MTRPDDNLLTRINHWMKESVMLKMATIIFLMLLLLIPLSMINSVITERESLFEQVSLEVGAKWSGSQLLTGPVLSIPVITTITGSDKEQVIRQNWHILPDDFSLTGNLTPTQLSRGIYDVVVYRSDLSLTGSFALPDSSTVGNVQQVLWGQAILSIGISDLRGIDNVLSLQWDSHTLKAEPGTAVDGMSSGVHFKLPAQAITSSEPHAFQLSLQLQGSDYLSVVPVGNTTRVQLQAEWPDPSFTGEFLPDNRTITDTGFAADWEVLQLNRNIPSQFIGSQPFPAIYQEAFGVDLLMPVDDYQKSMRSSKYAVMVIALTFLVFFLMEILHKWRIHPLQYALIGIALTLFYILLVSLSEFLPFNVSYAIAAGTIITIIALYSRTIVRRFSINILLSSVLLAIYGFVFVTLQLNDYALLIGSIGLVLILSITMYLTRKVDWYKLTIG